MANPLPTLQQSRTLLQQQIASAESQLRRLKEELKRTEEEIAVASTSTSTSAHPIDDEQGGELHQKKDLPLLLEEYSRYGRQMILEKIGLPGLFSPPIQTSKLEQTN